MGARRRPRPTPSPRLPRASRPMPSAGAPAAPTDSAETSSRRGILDLDRLQPSRWSRAAARRGEARPRPAGAFSAQHDQARPALAGQYRPLLPVRSSGDRVVERAADTPETTRPAPAPRRPASTTQRPAPCHRAEAGGVDLDGLRSCTSGTRRRSWTAVSSGERAEVQRPARHPAHHDCDETRWRACGQPRRTPGPRRDRDRGPAGVATQGSLRSVAPA